MFKKKENVSRIVLNETSYHGAGAQSLMKQNKSFGS